MNAEELKMILDAVSAVSGDAKSVLIWYFVGKFGVDFVHTLSVLAGILGAVWLVTRTVRTVNEGELKAIEVCSYLEISYYANTSADIIRAIERRVKEASK